MQLPSVGVFDFISFQKVSCKQMTRASKQSVYVFINEYYVIVIKLKVIGMFS